MAQFLAVKSLGALRPIDAEGEEAMRSIKQGDIRRITITLPRNAKHHRLYHALMSKAWENLDHDKYPTVENLKVEAKIVTGYYNRKDIHHEGKVYTVVEPKSTSYEKMDQAEFSAYFDLVCDWIVKDILPGVTKEELRQEIEIMTGIRG